MQRIDLRVLGAVEIINVVALNGLIEERQPQRQDQPARRWQRSRHVRAFYHWTGMPGSQRPHFGARKIAKQIGELFGPCR